VTIAEFQRLIESIYGEKDLARGTAGTFMWFTEEVGELARALKKGDRAELELEFADVFAWMATLASMHGVELADAAAKKYANGCPRCHATPCACREQYTAKDASGVVSKD
jgi:NTP pyrophosphatase (non-canonical NTP hydrolase)